jgi:hypothetical protein
VVTAVRASCEDVRNTLGRYLFQESLSALLDQDDHSCDEIEGVIMSYTTKRDLTPTAASVAESRTDKQAPVALTVRDAGVRGADSMVGA